MKSSLVLVSAVLLTFRIHVRAYTSHACKDGQVRLNCRSGSILIITEVFLADSGCSGSRCCPRAGDCKGPPSTHYRSRVLSSCNGRQNCQVDVEIRNIGCGILGPSNDYVNISYECQASTTTTTTTTTAKTTAATSPLIAILPGPVLVPTERLPSTTGPYDQLELESPSVAEVLVTDERSKGQGLETEKTSPGTKPGPSKTTKDSPPAENEAQKQPYADGDQNPDRMTIMTALIVAGIVIVTAVISAAVVMALKKRRIPKDSSYEMPSSGAHLTSAPEAADDDQHRRGSNFYDFIPDFRDSGHCSAREEEEEDAAGGAAAKENEYLKPMTDDEERPYDWIP